MCKALMQSMGILLFFPPIIYSPSLTADVDGLNMLAGCRTWLPGQVHCVFVVRLSHNCD